MITVLFGAPGAGKGTQADLLADRLGYKKISTGDALRKHIRSGTEVGLKARSYMDEGKLVPDDVLLEVLGSELLSSGNANVLLDGYPRNTAQAEALGALVKSKGIRYCIHLDVNSNVLVDRISGRRTCSSCGSTYHITYNPSKVFGVCDRCGGDTVQRPDDSEDKVKVRLAVYEQQTKPVLEFYKNAGLYRRVDGTGTTQEVFERICATLNQA